MEKGHTSHLASNVELIHKVEDSLSTFQDLSAVSIKKLFENVSDEFFFWLLTQGYVHIRDQALKSLLPSIPDEKTQVAYTGRTGNATLVKAFRAFTLFKNIAKTYDIDLRECQSILDFGCGWGRIIRFFLKDVEPSGLHGVDVNADVIRICRQSNLRGVNFKPINPMPPIHFPDNMFDIIYLYSVFSHLSEEACTKWLAEFQRILRAGGIVIATTRSRSNLCNNDNLRKAFPDIEKTLLDYDSGEFCHAPTGAGGILDRSFFGQTAIPKKYVEQHWTECFPIVDYIYDWEHKGFDQNVIIAQKEKDREKILKDRTLIRHTGENAPSGNAVVTEIVSNTCESKTVELSFETIMDNGKAPPLCEGARVFYTGARSHVPLPKEASVQDRLNATGNNTGNLLIGHAIKRQLGGTIYQVSMSAEAKYIEENFDYIVIGASNFLFERFDLSIYADFLEKVRLPCVIIGLGAQAPRYESKVKIPEGTIRMLKIISERSTTLGARGYFSASVLEQMGIKNIRVIGCPSMYWTCSPTMVLSKQTFEHCQRIAVNGNSNIIEHSSDIQAAQRVEGLLANLAFKNGYQYILQNEIAEMSIASGEDSELTKSLILSLKMRHGLLDVSDEDFIRFVKTNMVAFFDVEEWMRYIEAFDFVIGTRFHGCLIAILNGIPSVVLVHDARTREMCELLNIPHADIRHIETIDLELLYESMDLDLLETTYTNLYQNYIDFLEENGIVHNLER